MQVTWSSQVHYFWSWSCFPKPFLEGIVSPARYKVEVQYCVSPSDRWTNRDCQSKFKTLPHMFNQQKSKNVVLILASRWVLVQFFIPFRYQDIFVSILVRTTITHNVKLRSRNHHKTKFENDTTWPHTNASPIERYIDTNPTKNGADSQPVTTPPNFRSKRLGSSLSSSLPLSFTHFQNSLQALTKIFLPYPTKHHISEVAYELLLPPFLHIHPIFYI